MIPPLSRSEGPVPGRRLAPAATTGLTATPGLPPLDLIETPDLDLSDLKDLLGTLRVLQDAGIL